MDGPRFDAIARSFATRLTRRAAFRRGGGAAVTVLAAAGLGGTAAAQGTATTTATNRYAVIRRYKLATGTSLTQLATQLRDGYVPQLRNFPGFLGYRVVDTGNGGLTTITAFQTKQQEATAATQLAPWIAQHLAGLLPAPSQVESGAVLVNAEVCSAPVTPTATATSVAPTVTPTTAPPTQGPCTGQGCACSTGTQNPCNPGLICCPTTPGTPGGPGTCQPNSQCVCNGSGLPGVGCPCITGTQNPCGVTTLICCATTNRPGGPGVCTRSSVGCLPLGPTATVAPPPTAPPTAPPATAGFCTAAGCQCHTGTAAPCDSGLTCCPLTPGVPGGTGICKSAC